MIQYNIFVIILLDIYMNIVTYNYNNNFNNEYIKDLLINKEKLDWKDLVSN